MSRLLLVLLLAGSLVFPARAQAPDALYRNYRRALAALQRAIAAHGGLPQLRQPAAVITTGSYYNLGHYATPHATRQWPLTETFTAYEPADRWLLQRRLLVNGSPQQQRLWLSADTLYAQEYGANKPQIQAGRQAPELRQELQTVWPASLLLLAYECRASLRLLDSTRAGTRLLVTSPAGTALLLQLGPAQTLDRVEWLEYHPTNGDGPVTVEYQGYRRQNGQLLPTTRRETRVGVLEKELTYQPPRPVGALPDSVLRTLAPARTWATRRPAVPQWQVLPAGRRLHILQAAASEAKVLVAEFADHLAVFDVPTGLQLNQELIDTLARLYPRKPIRQVFVSHHHPAHAGGLRAYTAAPVSIITTPGSQAYLQAQTLAPHTLGSTDVAAQSPRFTTVPVGQATTFADKFNAVQVWELGPDATHHTREYCVYYFPAQRVLFVGDLVSFKADGSVGGGERGRALYEFINRQGLRVEHIYTAWPVQNQRPFGTLAELRAWAVQHP
ncbi:hypothetical protein GCM10027048_45700 [Hymenobacter coalescens]